MTPQDISWRESLPAILTAAGLVAARVFLRRKMGGRRSSPVSSSAWERFEGCALKEDGHNDGDSFWARLPDGREEQFRLNFVDCPESAVRTYRSGETNGARIAEQARYFGIAPDQAVEIGRQAKDFVHARLAKGSFTLFTAWDDPYGDRRFHALVDLGKGRWLHASLVNAGLARIFTKPADLPDGTSAASHLKTLRRLEGEAKAARRGAWGMAPARRR